MCASVYLHFVECGACNRMTREFFSRFPSIRIAAEFDLSARRFQTGLLGGDEQVFVSVVSEGHPTRFSSSGVARDVTASGVT